MSLFPDILSARCKTLRQIVQEANDKNNLDSCDARSTFLDSSVFFNRPTYVVKLIK